MTNINRAEKLTKEFISYAYYTEQLIYTWKTKDDKRTKTNDLNETSCKMDNLSRTK